MNVEQKAKALLDRLGTVDSDCFNLRFDRQVALKLAIFDEMKAVMLDNRAAIIRALEQPESRAITALKVTLFGVECYLPASIAQAVQERCDESALEQREGFVMVPREPTPEMVNAACAIKLRRLTEFASGKDGSGIEAGIREDYAAMLAAAPKPEGSGHG